MTDPAEETGFPLHPIRLIAQLAAEPHVLEAWRGDTQNPRLEGAYAALREVTALRAARVANEAVRAGIPRDALSAETERAIEEGKRLTFEPSRIKWLLACRRARLDVVALPGHDAHRSDEADEAERLETLLHALLATMC